MRPACGHSYRGRCKSYGIGWGGVARKVFEVYQSCRRGGDGGESVDEWRCGEYAHEANAWCGVV